MGDGGSDVYLSGGPVSLRMAGFSLAVAEGDGAVGDPPSSSSSSSVASPSSSSLAVAVAQPLSLGLIGPSSSAQSPPSSPWRSAPGPEPSTPSSPATENEIRSFDQFEHMRIV